MAFSPELANFANEDDFVQRLVIPLLGRLGLGVVVNHHGTSESGMDLVVGEIDRFGHVRYHGVQVKYEASIGKSQSHDLVEDAREAFAGEFRHPQTGVSHRISSFFAINAGTISDEARKHFFASLHPAHGDNVRLLEGRDVVALDRSAAIRAEQTRDRLSGLLYECRSIASSLVRLRAQLQVIVDGDGNGVTYPIERLQTVAAAAWLAAPSPVAHLELDDVARLYKLASAFNAALGEAGSSPIHTVVSIKVPATKALRLAAAVETDAIKVGAAAARLASEIGAVLPI